MKPLFSGLQSRLAGVTSTAVKPSPGYVVVHTDEMPWVASPSPTVWRKRIEHRGGVESGRVTSVVRYDAGSTFPSHPHPDGEEILVLDGVFSDQHGDYPAGSYLLNPEGFEHAPFSREGCVLFVKLRQYAGVRPSVRVQTADPTTWRDHDLAGVRVCQLYSQDGGGEEMRLVAIEPSAVIPPQSFPGGEEIFVIDGAFRDEHGRYRAGSWVRYEPGAGHTPVAEEPCVLYVKKGHLA